MPSWFVRSTALVILAVCGAVSLRGVFPPPVFGEPLPTEFSATRAMELVRAMAQAPRPAGSAEHARVRDLIVKQFLDLGFETEVRLTADGLQIGSGQVLRFQNIVATLAGTERGRPIVLCAHYDSVPEGPGASDDASGVAVLLETARALLAGSPLRNDVVFLATDAEERGILGARAFVEEDPEFVSRIGAVLNFEARGNRGPSILFETSGDSRWLVEEFATVASAPVASSLSEAVYELLPNDTDLSVFEDAGVPGLNFAFIGGMSHYHTPLDRPENLDVRSLNHHGMQALAVTRHLGDMDLSSERASGTLIYFSLLRGILVRYGQAAAWTLASILTALTAMAVMRNRRMVGKGLLRLLTSVLIAGAVALCVQLLLMLFLWEGWLESAFRFESPWMVAPMLLLSIEVVRRRSRREDGGQDLALGAVLVFAVVGVAATVFQPGASFVFVLPTMCGALALVLRAGLVTWTLLSIPTVVLLLPFTVLLYDTLTFVLIAPLAALTTIAVSFLAPVLRRGPPTP